MTPQELKRRIKLPAWWDGSYAVLLGLICLCSIVFIVSVTLGVLQDVKVVP